MTQQSTGAKQVRTSNPEFQVHRLNAQGLQLADEMAAGFDNLLNQIKATIPEGKELNEVRTNLRLACYWTKNAMAQQPENQQ